MATKTSLPLYLWSLLLYVTLSQPPNNQNNVYRGTQDLIPNQQGNPRNSVTVTIDYDNDIVEIIYQGQDSGYNGIGFGNNVMDGTYAIIMDYIISQNAAAQPIVFETILGDHQPGRQQDIPEINVQFDEFDGLTFYRTITVTRPINGNEYSFPSQPTNTNEIIILPIIAAIGPEYDFYIARPHGVFDYQSTEIILSVDGSLPFNVTEEPFFNTTRPFNVSQGICCECNVIEPFGRCFNDPECEDIICSSDPYCCRNRWDDICILQSDAVCVGIDKPSCCGCTIGQGGPGCIDDPECENIICPDDPFCCGGDDNGFGFWDFICVNTALDICQNSINQQDDNDDNNQVFEQ